MKKQYFIMIKLKPGVGRENFMTTMTVGEKDVMTRHGEYLQNYLDQKIFIAFGPVMHPVSPFGFALAEVDNEEQLKDVIKNDPVNEIGDLEYYEAKITR